MTQALSVIGLLLSLAVLVILCMKGVNIFICGIVSSLVVTVFSGMDVYSTLKTAYMSGFVSFMQSWFLMFFIGTFYGKLLEVTGVAEKVAKTIMQFAGRKFSLIALPIAMGILVYCGLNGFVAIFIFWPIMTEVFKDLDVPKRLMPAMYFLGTGTFANFAPGTPSILNNIVTGSLGVAPSAGFIPGMCAVIFTVIVGCLWFQAIVNKCRRNDEHFASDYQEEQEEREERELPSLLTSALPLVLTVFCVNVQWGGKNVFEIEEAMLIGCAAAWLLSYKELGFRKVVGYIGESAESSVSLIALTCAIVGFGYVIQASPAFQTIVDLIPRIPGPPLVSLALATNVMCSITGTASGAAGIVAPILGPIYTAMGLNPEMAARTMVVSATAFDSVPHNGTVVFAIKKAKESHKTAYWPLFQMSVLLPIMASIVCMVVGSFIY
ncbi:MAG: GntP family permease [Erysipelotrichaceae bacterium]|nr:GntP family permease [Erysipelotrichaceae bacterium]